MENNLSPVDFANALLGMNACSEAREWADGKDYATAWDTCSNSDWMFFLIGATAPLPEMVNEQLICRFARQVVHLTDDPRVLACIEVREAWIRGEVSNEVRAAARDAARDAGWAAWSTAGYAGGSAARSAARSAAGEAARSAAWAAARAAARAAALGAALGARDAISAVQCDIIRELVPRPLLG